MSIKILQDKCIGCGKCVDICPGNLLELGVNGKVEMMYPKDCWGCAACLKECTQEALLYYIGEDMGGKGGYLVAKDKVDTIDFIYVRGEKKVKFTVNRKTASQY
ncbi:MAG: ferredoxin family protein [Clostridiaceae bacterium]|jgi:adenylylsulfate reductase subunit B|nr:ferredoxin family protein [Clostridiaceae bacterium]